MDKVQKIYEEVVRMHDLLPVMDGDNISVNYADRICTTLEMYIDSLQKEPVSGLDNGDMPVERWKQAVKAASNQRNYRSSNGLTETKDDYFVDGVQWADEHPKEEIVSEFLTRTLEKKLGMGRMCESDKEACNMAYTPDPHQPDAPRYPYFEAYKEGYLSAMSIAEDILVKMFNEYDNLTKD